jgi:ParB family chromosome partitioning protein
LREAVAGAPDVALTALLATLTMSVFFGSTGGACVDIRPAIVDLRLSADGIGESRAVAAMAARHLAWSERLPEPDRLWPWIAGQSSEVRLELLAYCVAVSINAVRRRYDGLATARFDQADLLASAARLDMADWWEPTREHYLDRVSKTLISGAVAEGASPQAAEKIQGMKIDAMAARAEELLKGTRWLPETIRTPELPTAGGA